MEYTIKKLGELAGISTRTLRYYDEIGLLKPCRVNSSGYRIYGEKEVDGLQQILFYRELGIGLNEITEIINSSDFHRLEALHSHLSELTKRQQQLTLLIDTVNKTILNEEGKIKMTDKEKFNGLKKQMLDENEQKYGQEIREKYGDKTVEDSNSKFMNMSKEQFEQMQALAAAINEKLEQAVREQVKPDSDFGQEIAKLHKEWLTFSWPSYSEEAHSGLVQMYTDDERFKKYYDKNLPGCAEFLKDAVHIMTGIA